MYFTKMMKWLMSISFLLFLFGCNDNEANEVMTVHDEVNQDNSRTVVTALIEAITAETDYQQELDLTQMELNRSISNLLELELSTKNAEDLRDLYLSSLKDYQNMVKIIDEEGITDENMVEIESLAMSANDKQLQYIAEIIRFDDIELPPHLLEDNE